MLNITFDDKKLKIGVVTDQLLAGGVQLAAIEQVNRFFKSLRDSFWIAAQKEE